MNNAANAFYDAGNIAKSLELRKKTVKLEPDNPDNYACLGKCYRGLHQLKKAHKTLSKGIKKFPDCAELHIRIAFVELAQGDYQKGFKSFDWRWQGDELSLPEFDFPKWAGENLNGKTVLVIPEQGFGDTVLMVRFLPALKRLGCTIKIRIKPPLRRLFSRYKTMWTP